MKFSIKNFFSKRDQIRRKLRIWSHLPKKSLMENFIFCAEPCLQCKLTEVYFGFMKNKEIIHIYVKIREQADERFW